MDFTDLQKDNARQGPVQDLDRQRKYFHENLEGIALSPTG